MTTERDDPHGHGHAGDDQNAQAQHRSGDDPLAVWATQVAAASLLRDGLSPSEVEQIVREAFQDYANFRKAVTQPHLFLVKRILAQAKLHMKLRGTEPVSDPEERAPHLLDVIRTKAALDMLTETQRTALRLLFHEQQSFEDVALELGVSVEYARRLIARTLRQLREWRPPREPGE
jgi:DNA-directed RNA polymerase specialized sigma subunit